MMSHISLYEWIYMKGWCNPFYVNQSHRWHSSILVLVEGAGVPSKLGFFKTIKIWLWPLEARPSRCQRVSCLRPQMSSLTHQLQLWYDWPINTLQDVAFVNPEQCPFCSSSCSFRWLFCSGQGALGNRKHFHLCWMNPCKTSQYTSQEHLWISYWPTHQVQNYPRDSKLERSDLDLNVTHISHCLSWSYIYLGFTYYLSCCWT